MPQQWERLPPDEEAGTPALFPPESDLCRECDGTGVLYGQLCKKCGGKGEIQPKPVFWMYTKV